MSHNSGNTGAFVESEQYGKKKKRIKDPYTKQRNKVKRKKK